MLTIPQSSPCFLQKGAPGVELREEVSQVCVPQPGKNLATRHKNHGKIHGNHGKINRNNGKIHGFNGKKYVLGIFQPKNNRFLVPNWKNGKKKTGLFSHCWTCFRVLPTKQNTIGFIWEHFPFELLNH